jgi:tRNA(Phe) wybutosine-synthesizing methylase Tyw3
MTKYTNIRRSKLERLLVWLATHKGITITHGGKHQMIIKYTYWNRPFPIPFKHGEINRYILDALAKKIVTSQICTQKEFDERIK